MMKPIMFKTSTLFKGIVMVALSTILFSFATLPGGDSYEVSLNDKTILKEHVFGERTIPTISLNQNSDEQLSINYSHCGEPGTARTIKLKDGNNHLLKEWKFADAPGNKKDPMTCKVKDIVAAGKGHNNVSLIYVAKESTKEIVLAKVGWTNVSAHK